MLPKKQSTSGHTLNAQCAVMINWLNVIGNFQLITRSAGMTTAVVLGKKLRKIDAYKLLAAHINETVSSDWSLGMVKNRYSEYLKVYKEAKRDSLKSGFGLTEIDFNNGITTIAGKMNSMCPYWEKMDQLFGQCQNMNPASVLDALEITQFHIGKTQPFDDFAPIDFDLGMDLLPEFDIAHGPIP
ncbi:hypothetical protein HK096_010165 [Nowakowskiella sp. JEL0078]|nr:hypothetical protein HK096_010165 [Nowakowskiella sp. JEL0078]